MSDSLQDQLLALGLAREKLKKQRQPSRRKPAKGRAKPTGHGQGETAEVSLEKAYRLKQQAERKQAERARRDKMEQDRQRRLLNNEIRAIIQSHRLNREDAEIPRNFMFRGRIRKMHVTAAQLKALNSGELGIAYLSGGYHLLANEHVKAVHALSAQHVVDLGVETYDDGDHPVPDDITW